MAVTRGRGAPRECPVPCRGGKCGATTRAGYLCCPTHWRRIDPGLRTEVLRLWGRWEHLMDPESWDAYIAARNAALQSLGNLPAKSRTTDPLP